MLNRRILRSKAVQAIYAFNQCREANYELAKQNIADAFLPDLNSMEVQDRPELKKKSKEAIALFEKQFAGKPITETNEELLKVVKGAFNYYENLVKKDFVFFKKHIVSETEQIFDWYLMTLFALVKLAELEEIEVNKGGKESLFGYTESSARLLKENKVIQLIKENQAVAMEMLKRSIHWDKPDQELMLKKLLRDVLRKDEVVLQYMTLTEPSLEQEADLASHICKNILLKHELTVGYFEENDSRWDENRATIKSLVNKTIKDVKENGALHLMELSPNWEEDKKFFLQLFSSTIENDSQYEKIIGERAKNWDSDRIALTDMAILKAALDEMINFPGIPVKVTINEYIDISKQLSTPKSKQFINGLLDKASADLIKDGTIKKSGRGLIDNK